MDETLQKMGSAQRGVATGQVVEDGYEFFAKRQLITLFSAPTLGAFLLSW